MSFSASKPSAGATARPSSVRSLHNDLCNITEELALEIERHRNAVKNLSWKPRRGDFSKESTQPDPSLKEECKASETSTVSQDIDDTIDCCTGSVVSVGSVVKVASDSSDDECSTYSDDDEATDESDCEDSTGPVTESFVSCTQLEDVSRVETSELGHDARRNQSFFLRASFDLITKQLEWEAQVLESLRIKYPNLPTGNEAIMYGHLKKWRTHGPKLKFVVVSPGLISFVSSSVSNAQKPDLLSSSPLILFGKHPREKRDVVKKIPLMPGTRCRAIDKKVGKCLFEILDNAGSSISVDCNSPPTRSGSLDQDQSENAAKSVDGRLWLASSPEERIRWMQVIENAAEFYDPEENNGSQQQKSVLKLDKMVQKMKSCTSEQDYLTCLWSTFGVVTHHVHDEKRVNEEEEAKSEPVFGVKSVDVPLEWLHAHLKLPRGGNHEDSDISQIFKDMQRDKVTINGVLYCGWGQSSSTPEATLGGVAAPGICSIVCALASEIQKHTDDVALTEAEALALSHQVLLSCNRTQSGGNTFDAVSQLCGHDDFTIIACDSTDVPPLKLEVYRKTTLVDNQNDLRVNTIDCAQNTLFSKLQGRKTSLDMDFKNRTPPSSPTNDNERRKKTRSPTSFNSKSLQQEILRSISKKKKPPQSDSWGESEDFDLGFLPRRANASTRVDVEVLMHYKVCNLNFQDETDAVWAIASASFKRTFALVGQRKTIAVGQGTVSITLSTKNTRNKT
mmetsp:Transcript_4628/g.8167  ORF Transcript_4628/g.8167 Transcript_4628/m.8167 type:complete len:734 (+) Transcript_4628:449-2650(+)|eukprot:CAMPEP_0203752326 /NCGR_PEP_ID=MMETSP0098-20131031/6259_1 /ASSEMBLY_ACC=CAM_ASM_000208 /TAXON_ID=96639 /ORGANISM=" , Strain NY0313808BC1" /LENGTH=733 /DNA_ID=CAMNT_0050642427 /DNA_START=412 /DNA_END=2613 /DNA_ORIENTATION=+